MKKLLFKLLNTTPVWFSCLVALGAFLVGLTMVSFWATAKIARDPALLLASCWAISLAIAGIVGYRMGLGKPTTERPSKKHTFLLRSFYSVGDYAYLETQQLPDGKPVSRMIPLPIDPNGDTWFRSRPERNWSYVWHPEKKGFVSEHEYAQELTGAS